MAENNQEYLFDPEKSRTANKLLNMSCDELAERYLLPNPAKTKNLHEELKRTLNLHTPDDSDYRFPLLASLMGVNLDAICVCLVRKVESIITDDGYKLNIVQICEDYENILRENLKETKRSVATQQKTATPFIQQTIKFISYLLLNKAYFKDVSAVYEL